MIETNSILRCGRGVTLSAGSYATEPALILNGGTTVLDPSLFPTWVAYGGALIVCPVVPIVIANNVAAGLTANISVSAASGSFGALLVGFPADRVTVPGVAGDLWLDTATMCVPSLGATSTAIGWSVRVPTSWPFPAEFRWQGLVLDNNNALTLTAPGAALLH